MPPQAPGQTMQTQMPTDGPQGEVKKATPRNAILGVGAIVIILLCVIPFWNSVALLSDPNYSFWPGLTTAPIFMICLCAGTLLIFLMSVFLFFQHGRTDVHVHSEQTIMMIATVFVSLLGLGLLLGSLPMITRTDRVYTAMRDYCDTSPITMGLYQNYMTLYNIRKSSSCATKVSVEQCPGFQWNDDVRFLKEMENMFHCSGFCYRNLAAATSTATAAPAPAQTATVASSLQTAQTDLAQSGQVVSFVQRQSAVTGQSKNADGIAEDDLLLSVTAAPAPAATADAAANIVVTVPYPPLFSLNDYTASCEGMMSRDLMYFGKDVGDQMYVQGVFLLVLSILVGFMKLIAFCRAAPPKAKQSDYGTTTVYS